MYNDENPSEKEVHPSNSNTQELTEAGFFCDSKNHLDLDQPTTDPTGRRSYKQIGVVATGRAEPSLAERGGNSGDGAIEEAVAPTPVPSTQHRTRALHWSPARHSASGCGVNSMYSSSRTTDNVCSLRLPRRGNYDSISLTLNCFKLGTTNDCNR